MKTLSTYRENLKIFFEDKYVFQNCLQNPTAFGYVIPK